MVSVLERKCKENGILSGNTWDQRQQLLKWRLRNLQMSAHGSYMSGIAILVPTDFEANTSDLPSSADAGPSNKPAALAPPPALSAERASAEDLKNASKDQSKEHSPVPEPAGRNQGKTFDPVRDFWQ